MIDLDRERSRAGIFLGAVAIFLVSAYLVVGEIGYLLQGVTTDADLVSAAVVRVPASRGGSRSMLRVEYLYRDGSTARQATQLLPPDSEVPEGPRVSIEYIPGSEYDS
ncbi:MAG: hypothetical protein SFX72_12825 [Isosphaeraceae bacterium]|nr:hypothetical protein [Isosphaeraceae bacterium]